MSPKNENPGTQMFCILLLANTKEKEQLKHLLTFFFLTSQFSKFGDFVNLKPDLKQNCVSGPNPACNLKVPCAVLHCYIYIHYFSPNILGVSLRPNKHAE